MNDRRPGVVSGAWLTAIASAMALATLVKIALALGTYGTNDVLYWEWFLARLQQSGGIGLYRSVDPSSTAKFFNHPPFMIHALRVLSVMAEATGIPFPFWLRLPAILADLGSTVLVWKLLAPQLGERLSPAALVLLAVAPPSIMISGFHGNTDPVMIFFVLLSLYLIDRQCDAWLAGVALGIGINIKVVPIIFMPAIALYLPDTRRRIAYFGAAGATFVAGSLPYILQDPVFIATRVFGYESFPGQWGLSRLLAALPTRFARLDALYAERGKFAVLAVIVAASLRMNRPGQKPPLFLQCGLVAFLLMALTPGFGVQYLAWLVPWVVGIGLWAALLFYVASGVFLFLVYTFWSQGFPWYLADTGQTGNWRGSTIAFELLCWAAVVVVLLGYCQWLFFALPRERNVDAAPPSPVINLR